MAYNQSWLELLDSSNSCPNDDNTQPLSTKAATTFSTKTPKIEAFISSDEIKFSNIFKRRLSNEKLPEVKVENQSPQKGKRFKIDAEYEDIKEEPKNEDEDESELEEGELEKTQVKNDKSILSKKRFHSESSDASSSNNSSNFKSREIETDSITLNRRQKQIDYGKNTSGYDNYIKKIPKQYRTRDHPKTPRKHIKYSRRAWEGLIKSWRIKLHKFDDENVVGEDDNATAF